MLRNAGIESWLGGYVSLRCRTLPFVGCVRFNRRYSSMSDHDPSICYLILRLWNARDVPARICREE
jgi:hypothetical protein